MLSPLRKDPKMLQQVYTLLTPLPLPQKDLWPLTTITEQWEKGNIQIFQELCVDSDTRQLKRSAGLPIGGSTRLENLVLRWGLSNLKDGWVSDAPQKTEASNKNQKRVTEGEEDREWVVEGDDKYQCSWDWVISNRDWD